MLEMWLTRGDLWTCKKALKLSLNTYIDSEVLKDLWRLTTEIRDIPFGIDGQIIGKKLCFLYMTTAARLWK